MSTGGRIILVDTVSVGIWPFHAGAMRDKVAHNDTTLSTTTTTSIPSVPTNILQPHQLSSTTLSCSFVSPSSSSTPLTIKPAYVFTNIDLSESSSPPNTFDQIIPLQSTVIIDDNDDVRSSTTSSYTILQSCPLDLTLNTWSEKRKLSTSRQSSHKLQSPIADGKYLYILWKLKYLF